MKKHLIYWVAAVSILSIGCQKELSFEGSNTPAKGSLQSDITGDCLPKTVNGTYVAAAALVPATNTISVQVNVVKTGTYIVYTDTVNGYFFRATGTFTSLGANNVTLRGYGTPFAAGVNNFVVSFDTTFCDIQITVLPPGAGLAVFSLTGTPGTCSGAVVFGAYAVGVPLNSADSVRLSVNVTTIGTYNITTTPTGGMTFTGSGTFTSTGVQNVILTGTPASIPTTVGTNTIPVTAGTSNCSFNVTVTSAAAGTLSGGPAACSPSTVFGTYTVGTALNAGDTVHVEINVTTAGAYNITTNTVTGFSFAGSGTVAVGNNQTIKLTATGGPPTTAGPQTFTVTFGTSSCTFVVNCNPAPSNDYFPRTTNSNWSYEWNDVAADSLYRTVITPTMTALGNIYNIFMPDDGGGLDSTGNYPAGYYRRSGGDYFEWFNYGAFIGYDNPGWAAYIMLKDNVPALTNWKSGGFAGTITPPGITLNIRFSYTVIQKDVPITIIASTGTVNYQNVIVVEEKYEVEVTPGVWVDYTSTVGFGRSYYARGIGLIKYEAYDNTLALTDWLELRRYQVF